MPFRFCHLEGQAVRIADKISYLISDIEDGLSINILSVKDLLSCRLFHRAPLNLNPAARESGFDQFLRQRHSFISLLMEDIINASTLRISRKEITSLDIIRKADDYYISYSTEIETDVKEVWTKLQAGLLFKDKNVLKANLMAAKIVSELVVLFTLIPELIDTTFRDNHQKLHQGDYMAFYRTKVGNKLTFNANIISFMPFHLMVGTNYSPYNNITDIKVEKLIMAKDYVSSLSDYKAKKLHKSFFKCSLISLYLIV